MAPTWYPTQIRFAYFDWTSLDSAPACRDDPGHTEPTMTSWDLQLAIESASEEPLFLQIARSIADGVAVGRFRAGDPIPGSRTLSRTLGVHRNTVLAAYRELESEGWIVASRGRGTYLSEELPEVAPRRFARKAAPRTELPARVGFDLDGGPAPYPLASDHPAGTIAFAGGMPDLRLVPVRALARAYRRALQPRGRRPAEPLGYGDPRGNAALRGAIAEMMSRRRGLGAAADSVLVTRGSQMAVDLVSRALIRPGDVVAVEALGYRPAWEAFRAAGARLVPLPVDDGGVSVDALEALVGKGPVRVVYVTPHHQYPTTVGLVPGRRLSLLALAERHRIAVVEDDYDHEFHYDGRPVLPLASADRAGVVVYLGTLSKILAPGLRLGFVVAPTPLIENLAARRSFVDRQGDLAVEAAVAELVEDGELQRHVRRMRKVYRARRDALAEALVAELGGVVEFQVPAGGMALWAHTADGIDAEVWAERAASAGAVVQTARRFAFDKRARPALRLGFAALSERELREGVRRLAAALPKPR